ncbi:FadR/GntR family transcriptional regulator [Cognatazoarcus halotolerans]|uniref:FadR/GntR family transcriptional regulator n=1 Tax=Cognatazoarcus halotolerans TaxID=2686016 RepID=UPI00135CCD18|nr:FadR/GntR family transcriptional regulator [Cognatazoarcus halotolerans]MCB1902003.1 FadR family transcriptional regulator [Rhodocyclaceae bacterium]MCP5309784.1 FadR family transcriptional regulator [Zoogloeaceae bacterium]
MLSSAIVRPPRLAELLSHNLIGWLRDGRLAPGDQLPTEKQLADQFAVSRTVVREAIARLKADGYVETRQGAGAFVAPEAGRGSFRLQETSTSALNHARNVFELRYLVELGCAELAAQRRTPADLDALQAPLACMADALRSDLEAASDDDAFHRAIAAATHNPLVERFVEFLGAQFSESRLPTWSEEGRLTGRARDAQAEHEALYRAIEMGDAAAARKAAARHLREAAKRLGIAFEESATASTDRAGADQNREEPK